MIHYVRGQGTSINIRKMIADAFIKSILNEPVTVQNRVERELFVRYINTYVR